MNFRRQTEEFNRIPIQTVASLLGVTLPQAGTARCPFPDHDDRNPSFEIKASGTRWICYSCNRSGGSIDFVKTYKGLDFLSAKAWLAEQARIDIKSSNQFVPPKITGTTEAQRKETTSETAPDVDVYQRFLELCALRRDGRLYFASRAISDQTVESFRIGQLHDARAVLASLVRAFGFSRVEKAGLLTKSSTRTTARLVFLEGSLVFPFLENGRVAYLQTRTFGRAERYGKWRNLYHRQRRIYNVDALTLSTSHPFAICEGIMDTLSAVELDYNTIGFMGVTAKLTADQIEKLRGKEVDILLDWDAQGEARAAKLQKELNRYGVVSTRKSRPSERASDLNEYLMETRGLA